MEGKSSDWLRGPSGPTVCRCCFAEGCYKDISTEYFWMGKREVYAEMLIETYDINIAYAQSAGRHSNSRLICEPCISRLRDAAEFKRQVVECEKMFRQYLDPGRAGAAEEVPEPVEKEVKLEQVKQEKGQSDDDFDDRGGFDDDDDDLDDQPLTRLQSKVPKKESVDLLDLLDNAKAAEKRKSTTKSKTTPAKKAKTKKDTPKATASKPKPEKKKKVPIQIDPVRRNAEAVIKYTSAYPFRVNDQSILCVYCGDLHDDPSGFRRHMGDEHAKFNHRMPFEKLPKSEYVKVDVSDLRCRICALTFPSLEFIMTHLKEVHHKDIFVKSPFGVMTFVLDSSEWRCHVCQASHPSLLHLNRHTITHFRSYVCEVCGKSYVATTGLLQHVRLKHDLSYNAPCRRCGMVFTSLEAKTRHQKTEKKCMAHCCTLCPDRFTTWEMKQQHMVEQHGMVKKTYQCATCNVTFTTRRAFYDHYKLCHSRESIACAHCGLKFSTSSRLKRHLGRKHSV